MGNDIQPISGPVGGATPLVAARLCNFPTGSEGPLFAHRFWIESTLKPLCDSSPNPWIDVFGYASHRGSKRGYDNLGLSARRRNEVIKEILKQCPKVHFVQQVALGDSQSTGDVNDDSGDWRAVSVYLYGALPPGRKPAVLPIAPDWFVTSLNLSSFSAIVAAGFTAVWGHIVFEQPSGVKYSGPIGMVGPSVGLGLTPNIGKLFAKVPGLSKFLGRFPLLGGMLTAEEEKFVQRVLLYLWAESPKVRAAITAFPPVRALMAQFIKMRSSLSASDEDWWSAAIGLVDGKGGRTLTKADFSGPCVCYAVTGAAGLLNGGTYVLFFGVDRHWSPMTDPLALIDLTRLEKVSKGVALIAAASASANVPGLSAGATVFFGEIT